MPGISYKLSTVSLPFCLAALTACNFQEEHPYFPLEKKLRWHYATTMEYTRRSIDSKLIIENVGARNFDGETVFIKRNHAGNETYFFHTEESVFRNMETPSLSQTDRNEEFNFVLPATLNEGDSWQLHSRPYVIEHAIEYEVALQTSTPGIKLSKPLYMEYRLESMNETVDVPAGRYYGCAMIVGHGTCNMSALGGNFSGNIQVVVEHTDWYCPGVGLTKTVRTETDPSSLIEPVTYRQELEKIIDKSNFW